MAIIRPNADPLPVGNMHINFVINQVIRKDTDRKEWEAYSHDMKYSINGGSNVINPKYNLNIWIVELPPGLGGYATYPSSSSEHQGAVLLTSRISSESGISMTITHEIGHWLNLRHTFLVYLTHQHKKVKIMNVHTMVKDQKVVVHLICI
eukprot:193004_1